jgi:hypothetical protein
LYRRYGQRVAAMVREYPFMRNAVTPLFTHFLLEAQGA